VLQEGKIYIPKNEKLRVEIIQLYHDVPAAGHGGKWKMTELITRNYWWPEVTKNIEKYMNGCDMCQRIKNMTEALTEKLKLSKVLERPWIYLMVDFITKLPLVAGKNVILVVYNRLSKMMYFVATTEKTSAGRLARLFRDNM